MLFLTVRSNSVIVCVCACLVLPFSSFENIAIHRNFLNDKIIYMSDFAVRDAEGNARCARFQR